LSKTLGDSMGVTKEQDDKVFCKELKFKFKGRSSPGVGATAILINYFEN